MRTLVRNVASLQTGPRILQTMFFNITPLFL